MARKTGKGDDTMKVHASGSNNVQDYTLDEYLDERNVYGDPIVAPEYFLGEHDFAILGGRGDAPVCNCGWTRHDGYELIHHLWDQYPYTPEGYKPPAGGYRVPRLTVREVTGD